MALFEARDLACQRGERVLFAGLDFRLGAGEALLLKGANGSGKSSLLRLAAGLLRPAAGAFLWNDQPIRRDGDAHHRRLIYLGHADALKAGLTVEENLRFWADLAGLTRDTAGSVVAQALDTLGLAALAGLPARFLSAGQRRRLTLARLLLRPAASVPLWLLDEPTNALDAQSQLRLLDLMRDHLAAGGVIMLASHEALDALPGQRLAVDDFEPEPLHLAMDISVDPRADPQADPGADLGEVA
ncbi:MAG TPA: heme ABC exporter ATP-binding protein CcmA [Dongiaceae bacterium]|nr:heme ABC exporter ATP-binding protein CcmA [Dongiaceae bacterium]